MIWTHLKNEFRIPKKVINMKLRKKLPSRKAKINTGTKE
jgi:hypothetical protein